MSQAVHQRYRCDSQRAVEAGVFGAPSYVVDGEIFWGQDRLDFLQRRLAGLKRDAPRPLLAIGLVAAGALQAQHAAAPVFDAHLHYNDGRMSRGRSTTCSGACSAAGVRASSPATGNDGTKTLTAAPCDGPPPPA